MFFTPAELSRTNHQGFFCKHSARPGEICWEPESSGQGCPAKRQLQPVLEMEEQGTGPRVASRGVSSPGKRSQAAGSAKPSWRHLNPFQKGTHPAQRCCAQPRALLAGQRGEGQCSGENESVRNLPLLLQPRPLSPGHQTCPLGGCSPHPAKAVSGAGVLRSRSPTLPFHTHSFSTLEVYRSKTNTFVPLYYPMKVQTAICRVPVLQKGELSRVGEAGRSAEVSCNSQPITEQVTHCCSLT